MTDAKLQKAREAAAKAQRELEALEAAETDKAATLAAERKERAREYAERFLGTWRSLASEVTASSASTEYDPDTMGFLEGVIQWATGREMRRAVTTEAENAEHTLGISRSTVPQTELYTLDIASHIDSIIHEEVTRRADVFRAKLAAEREAYVNGGEA
jgi:hypothetical protein